MKEIVELIGLILRLLTTPGGFTIFIVIVVIVMTYVAYSKYGHFQDYSGHKFL